MRIGEIAVVGPHTAEKRAFIQTISNSVEIISEKLTFGRLSINQQLVLHLYGISVQGDDAAVSWDLIAPKLLGYIALFRWGDVRSFRDVQKIVNELSTRYDTTIVVAGHLEQQHPKIPAAFASGIPIDRSGIFTFCNVFEKESVQRTMLTLINNIIEQFG